MSDAPSGPGWWQASDGKWYPPEQAPGGTPPADPGAGASGYGVPYGGGGGTPGTLDLGSSLTYGWNKFVQNIGDWILLWLSFVAISIIGALLIFAIGGSATGLRFNFVGILVGGIVIGAVQGVLYVILAKAAIAVTRGERPEVSKAFALTGNNLVAGAIFGIVLGLLSYFCFIFGIVAWLLIGFLPIIAADRDAGAEAAGEAFQLQTSRFGESALLLVVAWAISAFTCGLGVPVAEIALAHGYKTMRGEPIAP